MRGSTAALMAAALLMLLVSPALLMLLLSPAASDTYEQETRRMFVQWKAKYKITYKYAGEEECRYALFKDARRIVALSNAAGVTTTGFNGLSAHASEEFLQGEGVRIGEGSYEEETRRMFVGWKAKYKKTYRDVGEEECRYMLFKGNRRVVVDLNAAAAGKTAYGLNQFGDLTNEEVRESCDGEMEGKLSALCQAAVAGYAGVHLMPIRSQLRLDGYGHVIGTGYLSDLVEKERGAHHDHGLWNVRCADDCWQLTFLSAWFKIFIAEKVCRCIASELKQAESGGSVTPGDEAHMWIHLRLLRKNFRITMLLV